MSSLFGTLSASVTGNSSSNGNSNSASNSGSIKKYLIVFIIAIAVFTIFNRTPSSSKDISSPSKVLGSEATESIYASSDDAESSSSSTSSNADESDSTKSQSTVVSEEAPSDPTESKDYYPHHQVNVTYTNTDNDDENPDDEAELGARIEEINVAMKAAQDPNAPDAPGAVVVEELGGFLFLDGDAYEKAPFIKVPPPLGTTKSAYKKAWSLLREHEEYFRTERPHRLHIPHLAQPISRQEFHETFRLTSTPVVIPFEYMRHLGVRTKAWTLDEMINKFPYTPAAGAEDSAIYSPKSGVKDGLDLGPALYALKQDAKLVKKGGYSRNFPRNLMIKSKYLPMLEVSRPPFLDKYRFQAPTLWFV